MLEVVGVTGVLHLGQIQSGLRSAIRIAQVMTSSAGTGRLLRLTVGCAFQGGHIRIRMNSELPIQVDGEPWIQCAGEIVVLKSALKVSALLFCGLAEPSNRFPLNIIHSRDDL